jgi:hypothetical protein
MNEVDPTRYDNYVTLFSGASPFFSETRCQKRRRNADENEPLIVTLRWLSPLLEQGKGDPISSLAYYATRR